jgi:hypothetical protein
MRLLYPLLQEVLVQDKQMIIYPRQGGGQGRGRTADLPILSSKPT